MFQHFLGLPLTDNCNIITAKFILQYLEDNKITAMITEGLEVTPKQCRMARAGLDWKVADLAKNAGISPATVVHFEKGRVSKSSTIETIESTLLATGRVVFSGNNNVTVDDEGESTPELTPTGGIEPLPQEPESSGE